MQIITSRRVLRAAAACASLVALVAGVIGVPSSARADGLPNCPVVIAHRGGPSVAGVENAPSIWRNSLAQGFLNIEVDVRFTSDGVPVIMHDPKVNRTTNGRGYVSRKSFAKLEKLHIADGEKVPQLLDVLTDVSQAHGYVMFELKVTPSAPQWTTIMDELASTGMTNRVIVESFLLKPVVQAQQRGLFATHIYSRPVPDAWGLANANSELVRWNDVTPEFVDAMGTNSMFSYATGIAPSAEATVWSSLLFNNVAGILTDDPSGLTEWEASHCAADSTASMVKQIVPDVSGLSISDAVSALNSAGFNNVVVQNPDGSLIDELTDLFDPSAQHATLAAGIAGSRMSVTEPVVVFTQDN